MKTLKKLSAVLLSVMLLAALLPANLAFAGTGDTLPVFYNFGDCVIADSSSDFSIHNASYELSSDSVYGKTLKVSGESGKTVQIRYRGTADTCYSANGSLTIKTAIKKYDKNIDTGLRFGVVSDVQPIAFNTDGYIYIAGEKTPYTYDVNVWYEVTMTVNHNTGYTESIINGGTYKNLVLSGYNEALIQAADPSTKNRAYIGAYDGGATGATAFELGYFSVSAGTLTKAEASFTDDFENSIVSSDGKNIDLYSNSTASNFTLADDNVNGKVLKISGGNTYRDMSAFPLTGTHTLSMSVKAETGAIVWLRNTDGKEETQILKFNTSKKIQGWKDGAATDLGSWTEQWYNVAFSLNMTDGTYSVSIADASGNSVVNESGLTLTKITEGKTPRLRLKTESGGSAYYDNISLAVDGETIRLQNMTPAPVAKGAFVSAEPTVYFTQKLDASTVNKENIVLSTESGVYDDYTPAVSTDGKSIVIKHDEPLAENTEFTVKIDGVKSAAGDTAAAYTYSFTTAKAYELGTVSFGDATAETTGDVTASVNIKFNDDKAHEVVFIAAVYDKTSGELVTCDIDNRKGDTAVTGSADLTAAVTVPDDEKTYEVIAYLWDGIGTLRPYIAATPLV